MLSWLPWSIAEWLTVAGYVLGAAAMTIAGLYLAFAFKVADTNPLAWLLKPLTAPLRYVGYVLIAGGLVFGGMAIGRSTGARDCEAAWRQKNLEQQLADARRDLGAAKLASEFKDNEARELAQRKQDADAQIEDYNESVRKLGAALATCRRATADDDRRLCAITGNAAPGCRPAR